MTDAELENLKLKILFIGVGLGMCLGVLLTFIFLELRHPLG